MGGGFGAGGGGGAVGGWPAGTVVGPAGPARSRALFTITVGDEEQHLPQSRLGRDNRWLISRSRLTASS